MIFWGFLFNKKQKLIVSFFSFRNQWRRGWKHSRAQYSWPTCYNRWESLFIFYGEEVLQHDNSHIFHISVIKEILQILLQTLCCKTWKSFNHLLRRRIELLLLLNSFSVTSCPPPLLIVMRQQLHHNKGLRFVPEIQTILFSPFIRWDGEV